MLRCPELFAKSPVRLRGRFSGVGRRSLAGPGTYFAVLPLGRLQNLVYRLQDHFEVMQYWREDNKLHRLPPTKAVELNWDHLLVEAGPQVKRLNEEGDAEQLRHFADDAAPTFWICSSVPTNGVILNYSCERCANWGSDPLVFSMPIEYAHFERMGIAPKDGGRLRRAPARDRAPAWCACGGFRGVLRRSAIFADHFGHPARSAGSTSTGRWMIFTTKPDSARTRPSSRSIFL